MSNDPAQLYLELLKNALTFALWPEPPVPITRTNKQRTGVRRLMVDGVSRILRKRGFSIVRDIPVTEHDREHGRIWPGCADTMIGRKRLDNLHQCVETVLREGIPGDLIETGVWRGGSCIFMAGVLAAHGVRDRRIFVADSFRGLPEPDPERYPADRGVTWHEHEELAVSRAEVEKNFRRYGLLDDHIVFLEGWFKDTLPTAPIERLAVLRLDGDMYESTMDALTSLYPKLSPGGYCIVDDYRIDECQKAIHDYRRQHGITAPMLEIDWSGAFWRA
jgi:O-methyltransferase